MVKNDENDGRQGSLIKVATKEGGENEREFWSRLVKIGEKAWRRSNLIKLIDQENLIKTGEGNLKVVEDWRSRNLKVGEDWRSRNLKKGNRPSLPQTEIQKAWCYWQWSLIKVFVHEGHGRLKVKKPEQGYRTKVWSRLNWKLEGQEGWTLLLKATSRLRKKKSGEFEWQKMLSKMWWRLPDGASKHIDLNESGWCKRMGNTPFGKEEGCPR